MKIGDDINNFRYQNGIQIVPFWRLHGENKNHNKVLIFGGYNTNCFIYDLNNNSFTLHKKDVMKQTDFLYLRPEIIG